MRNATHASTEQRRVIEETARPATGFGRQHVQQPKCHQSGGVALAVCVASLILFGCVTEGDPSDAATTVHPGRSAPSASSTGAAAVADVNEPAVPGWVTELVDLPPGRVARVDDTSIWYLAHGHFDDVVALLVEQLGAPAPVRLTGRTLAQLSWHLERGSVTAVASQSLRWNPREAIIGVSRDTGLSTTSGR